MTTKVPQRVDAAPPLSCAAPGGCRHLRALATIEQIAGFKHAARSYGAAAAQCRNECWATRTLHTEAVAGEQAAPAIPLNGVREGRWSQSPKADHPADLIAFDRASVIDIISDHHGNYVERRELKLESLPARGDSLGYLYRYWRDLRGASANHFANIDTVHLERAGIIGKMHVVDVSSSDPNDFRFELFGHALPLGQYLHPRAYPVSIYADCTVRDYNTVRMTGFARLQRIRTLLGGTSYHYSRLILPFLNFRDRVTHLAIAIRQEVGDGLHVETKQ